VTKLSSLIEALISCNAFVCSCIDEDASSVVELASSEEDAICSVAVKYSCKVFR